MTPPTLNPETLKKQALSHLLDESLILERIKNSPLAKVNLKTSEPIAPRSTLADSEEL